jgi:hypothetical protein
MLHLHTIRHIRNSIRQQGYSVITGDTIPLSADLQDAWDDLRDDYNHLPPDEHLPGNNAVYRYRRYDSFYFHPMTGRLHLLPHQPYFQNKDINPVTGGIQRDFAPLRAATVENPFLRELIRFNFEQFPLHEIERAYDTWQVDVHEILVTADPNTEGHPTPEGIHKDGAEFVTVHLALLDNADGGEVTIYDDSKQPLDSFRLHNELDSYLFDDARLWHGVTPITSADGVNPAVRGILTFDYHYKPDLKIAHL